MNIYPLFSSVVSASIIDLSNIDCNSTVDYIEKNLEFASTSNYDNSNSFATTSITVLDKLPKLKNKILNEFYFFKNKFLRWEETNFDFTTSWFTKTLRNGSSQFHTHKNCLYSGILYFDSYDSGNLVFENNQPNSIKINPPTEYNIYNFESFFIQPQQNLLVFFPSSIRHKVDFYTGTKPRYSLAFNLHPVGEIGVGDSSINISIN